MDNKHKIEIARSFGQNLFLEAYKPINFFCSAKAEVSFEEAEAVAKELYHLCKSTVEKDIEDYKREKEEEHTIRMDSYNHSGKKVSEEYPEEWKLMKKEKEEGLKSKDKEKNFESGDGYKQNSEK